MDTDCQAKRKMIRRFARGTSIRWFLALFLVPLAPWWLVTDVLIRDFWDTQYVMKINGLSAFVAETKHHPLWVVMGSSHVNYGLAPGVLADYGKRENGPVMYNFGLGGADPFRQFICLRRMIRDGIKPDHVGIELAGFQLGGPFSAAANEPGLVVRARSDELADYYKYSSTPDRVRAAWYESRIRPTFTYGTAVPIQAVYLRFPTLPFIRKKGTPPPYDHWGWDVPQARREIPEAQQTKINKEAKDAWAMAFKGNFKVSRFQRGIVDRILELCRREKIAVFLLRMPESDEFQQIYTPQANAAINAYIVGLTKSGDVSFVDARSWVGIKGFYDGHHLNLEGAEEFTRHLGDVLFTDRKQ